MGVREKILVKFWDGLCAAGRSIKGLFISKPAVGRQLASALVAKSNCQVFVRQTMPMLASFAAKQTPKNAQALLAKVSEFKAYNASLKAYLDSFLGKKLTMIDQANHNFALDAVKFADNFFADNGLLIKRAVKVLASASKKIKQKKEF